MRPIAAFKNSFVAGLIVVAPLVVTVIVLEILSGWTLRFVNPVVENTRLTDLTGNDRLLAQVLGAVLIAVTIAAFGWVAQWSVGKRLFGTADRAVNLIPLVSVIYGSVRQMANSMVSGGSDFDRVVLLEYPIENQYVVGLVTGETPSIARPSHVDGDIYNVYLPGSPNPTAGRLTLVPDAELIEVEMSVRQGLTLLVTTGATSDDEAVPAEILEAADTEELDAGNGG